MIRCRGLLHGFSERDERHEPVGRRRRGQLLASLIAFKLEADEQQRGREAALAEAKQEAAVREEFLGSVAHDLKNPLTSIRGYAELLKRQATRGDPAPAAQLLNGLARIEGSASKMAASLDELMDVARLRGSRSADRWRRF